MFATVVCFVSACGPSLRAIEEHNLQARAEAGATIRAAGRVFEPSAVTVDPEHVVASEGSHGLEHGETLYTDTSGQLVFVSEACAMRARCGDECARRVEYSYHHAPGGRVIIVRSHVEREVARSEDDPSCPAGCGGGAQRSMPMPTSAAPSGMALGVNALDRVELRTVAYVEQVVERVCTNTTPVP